MENVLVSNGGEVVKTDSEGAYSLTRSERDKFIFITTLNGYL